MGFKQPYLYLWRQLGVSSALAWSWSLLGKESCCHGSYFWMSLTVSQTGACVHVLLSWPWLSSEISFAELTLTFKWDQLQFISREELEIFFFSATRFIQCTLQADIEQLKKPRLELLVQDLVLLLSPQKELELPWAIDLFNVAWDNCKVPSCGFQATLLVGTIIKFPGAGFKQPYLVTFLVTFSVAFLGTFWGTFLANLLIQSSLEEVNQLDLFNVHLTPGVG